MMSKKKHIQNIKDIAEDYNIYVGFGPYKELFISGWCTSFELQIICDELLQLEQIMQEKQ